MEGLVPEGLAVLEAPEGRAVLGVRCRPVAEAVEDPAFQVLEDPVERARLPSTSQAPPARMELHQEPQLPEEPVRHRVDLPGRSA